MAKTKVGKTVESLGDYLREQRVAARLSLRQLAEQAGVSNPYLSQIERGLRKPSAEVLQQIAKALRISAEQLYIRSCDGKFQYVYVGPHSPVDVAHVAYQKVAKLVPKPETTFSPPVDRMVVNFESWLGVTPRPPVTATATIPGLSATVTATPTTIEWSTGTKVAGDTETISCALWGSAQSAQDGCAWTPAYPSVAKVTGTNDRRYHGAVTIVWRVSWQATNGATGDLGELRTTTPVRMGVQEIQTIGG